MVQALLHLPLNKCLVPLCEQVMEDASRALHRADAEMVHDVRVALRRLRVLVAHYARADANRRKLLRRAAKVMKASNPARDSEVMRAWLVRIGPTLESSDREGAMLWRRSLRPRRGVPRLKPKKLRSHIEALRLLIVALTPKKRDACAPFAKVTAHHLQQQAQQLQELMMQPPSQESLHTIRLQMKSLRYLLSPVGDSLEACHAAHQALQGWQERLGEWHDTLLRQQHLRDVTRQLMEAEPLRIDGALAKGEGPLATRPAPALKGLVTLLRINGTALRAAEAVLWRDLHGEEAHRLARQVAEAIASLAACG